VALEEAPDAPEQQTDGSHPSAASGLQATGGTLDNAYEQLQGLLGKAIEPFSAVQLVEEYRDFWRPRDVKVILLVESHARTSVEDTQLHFDAGLSGYPTEYCKYVYCLAYGERALTASPDHPRDGTPQYWKILYSCGNDVTSNDDFAPIQAKTPYEQRVQNKIALLTRLQEMGVWLVDASIVGLSHKGRKPSRRITEQTLLISWQLHTFDLVRRAKPRHVICAGKQLAHLASASLHNLVGDSYTVVSPANSRLSAGEHLKTLQTYRSVCAKYCP
jgi:hypothetical protein